MLTKESQLAYKGRKRKARQVRTGYDGAEQDLQSQMDDMLEVMAIEYRRIPDQVWRWIVANCPIWATKSLAKVWKGRPDTLALIPISDKYSLAVEIELKNKKGNLTTGQEQYSKRMPVHISRSVDESVAIVQEFARIAEALKREDAVKNGK